MTLHLTSIDRATDPDRIFAEHLAELEADRAALRLALDNFRVADPKDAKRIRLLQLRAGLMLSLAMVSTQGE